MKDCQQDEYINDNWPQINKYCNTSNNIKIKLTYEKHTIDRIYYFKNMSVCGMCVHRSLVIFLFLSDKCRFGGPMARVYFNVTI